MYWSTVDCYLRNIYTFCAFPSNKTLNDWVFMTFIPIVWLSISFGLQPIITKKKHRIPVLNDLIGIIVFVRGKWSWVQIGPLRTRKLEGVDELFGLNVSNANCSLEFSLPYCRWLVISCVSCWRRSIALLGRSVRDASFVPSQLERANHCGL